MRIKTDISNLQNLFNLYLTEFSTRARYLMLKFINFYTHILTFWCLQHITIKVGTGSCLPLCYNTFLYNKIFLLISSFSVFYFYSHLSQRPSFFRFGCMFMFSTYFLYSNVKSSFQSGFSFSFK